MTELEEDSGAYERGSHWAEPDVAQAATLMRHVFEHREEGSALGLRGAAKVRAALDPNRTVREIRQRVDELG